MRKNTIFYILLFFLLPTIAAAEGIVKVIYFVPRDRTTQQNISQKLDSQIKAVQTLYAEQKLVSARSRLVLVWAELKDK